MHGTNLAAFRAFKGSLFPKPGTGQVLFWATRYNKVALVVKWYFYIDLVSNYILTFDSFYYSNVEEGKNDEEMEMPGCFESTKEASLLTSLGAFGQSWDVYSDIGLLVQFANGEFNSMVYHT